MLPKLRCKWGAEEMGGRLGTEDVEGIGIENIEGLGSSKDLNKRKLEPYRSTVHQLGEIILSVRLVENGKSQKFFEFTLI